jgi:hypothetical protein
MADDAPPRRARQGDSAFPAQTVTAQGHSLDLTGADLESLCLVEMGSDLGDRGGALRSAGALDFAGGPSSGSDHRLTPWGRALLEAALGADASFSFRQEGPLCHWSHGDASGISTSPAAGYWEARRALVHGQPVAEQAAARLSSL